MPRPLRLAAVLSIVVVSAFAAGCGSSRPFGPPPEPTTTLAPIPGFDNVRFWGDGDSEKIGAMGLVSFRAEQEHLKKIGHTGPLPPAVYIALSGGGENGAFGAGLLCGWTAHGDRPDFKLVTGISTGALIAPLAFLGPEQDAELRRFYTTVTVRDIARKRGALAALTDDAMADTAPLANLIANMVDEKFLQRVAEEYAKGRMLIISTTNIDAERPVLWDMGAIAKRGGPEAADLFRKVMLASASIPAAFPPQYIEIEIAGQRYDEMHVDGGTTSQVFVYPASLNIREVTARQGVTRERVVYVMRNGRLGPTWDPPAARVLPIAGRSISALVRTQGVGDLYRIYLGALRDGLDFNLAYIPDDLPFPKATAPFDTVYMTNLFEYGFNLAKKGYPWSKTPPGFEVGDIKTAPAK